MAAEAQTQDFPPKVDAYIVRKGTNKIDVVDAAGKSMKSILVHYDGEIEWHCDLGPWEVLRKMDGKNPFPSGKNGVKKASAGSAKIKTRGQSASIVVCGYTVAVWDETDKKLFLLDPDIVVGPPTRA